MPNYIRIRCVNGEHGGESVQSLLVDDGNLPIRSCIRGTIGCGREVARLFVTVAVA